MATQQLGATAERGAWHAPNYRDSASGDRRKEGNFGATAQGLRLAAHDLVNGHADGLATGQAVRIRHTTRDQLIAKASQIGCDSLPLLGSVTDRLADGSKEAQCDG